MKHLQTYEGLFFGKEEDPHKKEEETKKALEWWDTLPIEVRKGFEFKNLTIGFSDENILKLYKKENK